jgi:hypothetical protein
MLRCERMQALRDDGKRLQNDEVLFLAYFQYGSVRLWLRPDEKISQGALNGVSNSKLIAYRCAAHLAVFF